MIAEGRTIRQGVNAGNMYELRGPLGFNYMPPAATDPSEVIQWAIKKFPMPDGEYYVNRIIGGGIGCFFVEEVLRFEI